MPGSRLGSQLGSKLGSLFRLLRHSPILRPFIILIGCVVLFAAVDGSQFRFLSLGTLRSTLQSFATLAPIALGLGLAMLAREFDLSIAGLFGLAGCVAVLTGVDYPLLGLLAAVAVGLAVGVIQGVIIVRLQLGSVAVTLGGLLICTGIALVISNNQVIGYANTDMALMLGDYLFGLFTWRSIVAIAIIAVVSVLFALTRIGRDIVAIGSNREAAVTTGVPVSAILIGVFGFSGALTALSGGLVSFSLASASPTGLSDVLVPAAAAAILGGVSLSGGTGRPLSIALGVLVLSVLRAGVNAIGAPPFVNDLAIGTILLAVAIADGPELMRRFTEIASALQYLANRRSLK